MSLQSKYVDRIFARMLIRYGVLWIRMWENVDPDELKADWADVLGRFSVESLQYGLDNLPTDKPPTASQFRAICNNMPARYDVALIGQNASKASPEVISKMAATAEAMRAGADPHAWARALKAKPKEALTIAQREALERFDSNTQGLGTGEISGSFFPIPPENWPWNQTQPRG